MLTCALVPGPPGRHQLPKQLDQLSLALPFVFVSSRQPLPGGEDGWQQVLHVFHLSPNAAATGGGGGGGGGGAAAQ